MLFDRMEGVPDHGSPMEILFLVLWRMRQQIEFQKNRAIVQALMSQQGSEGEAIEKAFDDLRESFFPFEKKQRSVEIANLKKVMDTELARGALKVTPMVDLTRSTMKQKLAQGQEALTQRAEMLRAGKLRTLDGDPMEAAKRRQRKQAAASLTSTGPALMSVRPMNPHGGRSPA